MALYILNDILVVNTAYTSVVLPGLLSRGFRQQTLYSLSLLGRDPATVVGVGNLGGGKKFIKLVPIEQTNSAYRSGNGVTIYFDNDDQLDNSFEYSKAFIKDKCVFKVLNLTGATITKNSVVYQNGFDTTYQLPTIALASAAVTSTSTVLGVAANNIGHASTGSVVSEGSIIMDTSGYSAEGDTAYLSDIPGNISVAAGTETVAVGKVLCVGNPGSISVFSTLAGGANSGGSGGSVTPSPATTIAGPTYTIVAADNGKVLWTAADVSCDYGLASGLPDGFEITILGNPNASSITLTPQAGQQIMLPASVSNGGLQTAGATIQSSTTTVAAKFKLVGTIWVYVHSDGFQGPSPLPATTFTWYEYTAAQPAVFTSLVNLAGGIDLSTTPNFRYALNGGGTQYVELTMGVMNPSSVTRTEIIDLLNSSFGTLATAAPVAGSMGEEFIQITTSLASGTAEIRFVDFVTGDATLAAFGVDYMGSSDVVVATGSESTEISVSGGGTDLTILNSGAFRLRDNSSDLVTVTSYPTLTLSADSAGLVPLLEGMVSDSAVGFGDGTINWQWDDTTAILTLTPQSDIFSLPASGLIEATASEASTSFTLIVSS